MMMEHNDGMMIAAEADADKDEDRTDDDSSIAPTEASSTGADIDESINTRHLDSHYTLSYPSIAKPATATLTVLVTLLSVLVAANPSLYTSCGELVTSFFEWYLVTLEVFPLITKCITGALLSLVGDYCAQWFEFRRSDEQQQQEHMYECDSMLKNIISILSIHGNYDYRRGWATTLGTFLLSCPLQHFAYDYFESILPVESGSELYRSFAAMVHVCLDCLLLDGIFVALVILVGGVLEGRSLTNYVLPNLKHNYFAAYRAALLTNITFAPVEFLSFRFLPLSLRVLSVNAVDLAWDGVMSYATHGGAVVEKATA